MAHHMAWRRWGQRSTHNVPFRPACQWGLYAALARFWTVSGFLLRVSFSSSRPMFCYSVCFSLRIPFTFLLSISLVFFLQPLFPLLFLQWNTRPQPDGSSDKFQAACHTFCLGKRRLMHAWPTQQPLLWASGHAAAGERNHALVLNLSHF